ncbi:NAD+ kinase [Marchantia polymorpha subsp. ruderalis]|uniref:NAD(+) kinase n=2 Tax=Marchantia polymorpha TaxID=3197 RepID=A0AAF6BMC6_MARPO|nr:hypothetical protein MARPO_0052s0071 [Marchantia polymorpha]BBN13160.1 hypothetical protein Mp_6g01330 [Marchantia polymorpha subsp. ruderalis]|eukprot:PTQ38287.1 hypothetical protein MARPO_0052s0071 [Marchantia polymorpha]
MNSTVQESTLQAMPPIHLPTSQSLAGPLERLSLSRVDSTASLSQIELDSVKLGVEGWASLSAGVGSQRNLQEYFQESTAADEDSHLVEFSDALQTVARALRQVADSKARTQDEAAEWKRKYELEVVRCQHLRQSIAKLSSNNQDVQHDGPSKAAVADSADQQDSDSPNGMHSPPNGNGVCCSKEGICSQQVIREQGTSNSTPESENPSDKRLSSEKASFRLAWGCNGKSSRRHKHDVVSFESGNITTAVRSSKQITLQWDAPPQSVFILTKPNSTSVAIMCKEMVRWLKEVKNVRVFVEKNVKKELVEENSYFSFLHACERDEELMILHTKIDLVITLGGDGTVLWAANMFKGPVPPLVSFSMGSLGFMTPFQSERYKECLDTVMKGPVFITLRHRLHCRIIRNKDNDENGDEDDDVDHLVLNEVSIDRGMSSYLTNLECYCDNLFVTSVQGDGLILSTPSGSTAYSLAAGGSMVHPQVPGILFTPICPHSLSFRPLILPEYVTLRVQIPINSRGQAWASFDGKDRQKLSAGDALIVHMSAWPVPAACDEESTHDFLRSVREGLHWNLRKSQSFDGPREALVYSS